MSPVATADPGGLRRLAPEPWGPRLIRARETSRLRPTQVEAAAWIATVTMRPMSASTVSRLERLDEAPDRPEKRRNAYLLSVLYEVDPGDLDLTDSDGPGEQNVARLRGIVSEVSAVDTSQDARGVTIRYSEMIAAEQGILCGLAAA